MTADQYVLNVVAKYSVQTGPNSPAGRAGAAFAPILQSWAGQYLNKVVYSGSYAKGTAVSSGTDVDLFISLLANTPGTLKELYYNLQSYIIGRGFNPELRNVSMRVVYSGIEIDLVPGRMQSPYATNHSLYKRRGDTWIQTNIDKHISVVVNSQRTVEIKV